MSTIRRPVAHRFLKALIPLLILGASVPLHAREPATSPPRYSLGLCVEIALKNHQSIGAARSQLDANKAKLAGTRSSLYPVVNANTGYTLSSPALPNVTGSTGKYNGSITLQYPIYDFDRTRTQIGTVAAGVEGSESDLENAKVQILSVVKQSYFNLLASLKNRELALETIKQYEKHLEQAKGYFAIGLRPRFDVTKAEVDLGNARLGFVKADNAILNARTALNGAMGLVSPPDYEIEDTLDIPKDVVSLDDAIAKASALRPDLKSLMASLKAAESTRTLARKEYYPVLGGMADVLFSGDKSSTSTGWDIGISINVPIFSGFSTRYKIDETSANIRSLAAQIDRLKLTIALDIRQAYSAITEALQRIPVAKLTVGQAQENLDIVNGRYETGVGSPVEVTDAMLGYLNAKSSYIQALYDYNTAIVALEKAMGLGT